VPENGEARYELEWTFESRIGSEHLGKRLYPTSTRALCELVSNAFDAEAARVEVVLDENELGGIGSVTVRDDGHGISPEAIEQRFVKVGVAPDPDALFGRLGIGRLAVLRIGSLSQWTSVSRDAQGRRISVTFTLKEDLDQKLQVFRKEVDGSVPTGTTIKIHNLCDSDTAGISATRVGADLVNQFCSYLLANRSKEIVVNGNALDVSNVVASKAQDRIPPFEEVRTASEVLHLMLTMPVEKTVIKDQLIFSSRGRTVKTCDPGEGLDPKYLGLVDCPYLDEIVSSNREAVIEFDLGFSRLKSKAIAHALAFNDQYRSAEQKKFIERARVKEYYPYKAPPDNVITSVKKDLYDVVLERVHEEVNIEALSRKQQAIIFRLLKRVLESDDMLDV
jgi:hypothetical protein